MSADVITLPKTLGWAIIVAVAGAAFSIGLFFGRDPGADQRIRALETWKSEVGALAESRDGRLRTLETSVPALAGELSAIKATLARIEARMDGQMRGSTPRNSP